MTFPLSPRHSLDTVSFPLVHEKRDAYRPTQKQENRIWIDRDLEGTISQSGQLLKKRKEKKTSLSRKHADDKVNHALFWPLQFLSNI